MLSRVAGRVLTSPLAFFLAGVVDIAAYALGSARQRYARRRGGTWQ